MGDGQAGESKRRVGTIHRPLTTEARAEGSNIATEKFAQDLIADWQSRNLDAKPETFPKSARLGGDKMGAWLRLPGVHHSRDHITRVWSGDAWLDDPWEEWSAALSSLPYCRTRTM